MTFHKDLPYLMHILDAIKDIEDSTKDISEKDFSNKKDIKDANVRRLEIIGEAVKNISNKIKSKYPDVEWKKISGTRDKIIHHYFGVDFDVVWKIIEKDLPILKKQIQEVKKDLEKD